MATLFTSRHEIDEDGSDYSVGEEEVQTKLMEDDKLSNAATSVNNDAPEALVRTENKAVGIARIIVIFVLVLAAVGTSTLVYLFARDSEDDAFKAEFDAVAERLVAGMTSDVALKLWVGRTLSSAVTLAMQQSGDSHLNLTIPPALWDQVTQEARFNANVFFVSWSPLLANDQEREEFEAYTKTQTITFGANPTCYVCGAENRGYINPDDIAELPGFGLFPCAALDVTGRQGVIPEENCIPISQALSATCVCGDLPPEVVAQFPNNEVEIPSEVFKVEDTEQGMVFEGYGQAPYQAMWQTASLQVAQNPVMYNEMSEPARRKGISQVLEASVPVLTEIVMRDSPFYQIYHDHGDIKSPGTMLYYPVFAPDTGAIVGSVTMELLWSTFLSAVYPPQSDKVDLIVENSCGQNFTFNIDLVSESMSFIGEGDLHDRSYSNLVHSSTFEKYEQIVDFAATVSRNQSTLEYCRYKFHVFATEEFEDAFTSNDPLIYAIITGVIFIFTSLVFVSYDFIVDRRQKKVMGAATRTNDIVAELFPKEVRERLYERAQEQKSSEKKGFLAQPTKTQMQNFLSDDLPQDVFGSEPIADFFPQATIMFLDIAGFTAWSSEREPVQVFRLLETIYGAFDGVAKGLGVFKVETIGDSYVAVCGLPTPREQHAAIMAQFATLCLKKMFRLTRELEKYLGPSTGELRARVGLHSGPVTAGVLRGEKARFQLFGDTVNTASRLEASGQPHRIHASKETADLLAAAGKGHWLHPRKDLVEVKGKGSLQTYWISPTTKNGMSSRASAKSSGSGSNSIGFIDEEERAALQSLTKIDPGIIEARAKNRRQKNARLVEWNVEVLYSLLESVVANRPRGMDQRAPNQMLAKAEKELAEKNEGKIVIDEMTSILQLSGFDKQGHSQKSSVSIPPQVKEQLRELVTQLSNLYKDVPFHNFEHCSHVIMSAGKMMRRIVNPDGVDFDKVGVNEAEELHAQTYGLCSDKLMQFAVVFSALIHDVDHTGLTNAELDKMRAPVASAYRHKSIAEQNSVDVAWTVLMDGRFKDLRACIYTNEQELARFRQLIVNAVMATDIADKELKKLRESRWDQAFAESAPVAALDMDQIDSDRKATIVFEYIIQASDVAHTMQHWHTYQKFNRRLFEERYLAWLNGHAGEEDPSLSWYQGEIGFFDFYIIPLARKLEKCGVFGVSSDEYLNYAKENRKEWEIKGRGLVEEMLESCREKYNNILEGSEEHFREEDEDFIDM